MASRARALSRSTTRRAGFALAALVALVALGACKLQRGAMPEDAEAAARAMHDHLKLATSDLLRMPD